MATLVVRKVFYSIKSFLMLYSDVNRGLYFYKDISGVIVLPCDTKGFCEYYNLATGEFYRGSFLHILYLRSSRNA